MHHTDNGLWDEEKKYSQGEMDRFMLSKWVQHPQVYLPNDPNCVH